MRFSTISRAMMVMLLLLVPALGGCGDDDCPTAPRAVEETGAYVGAQQCGSCHGAVYARFAASGHNQHIQRIVEGAAPSYFWEGDILNPVPGPPNDLAWKDILMVVGGTNASTVFVGLDGNLVTGPKALWDVETGTWNEFYTGQTIPFDCGGCHLTGYVAGAWEEDGVACEACHGPGREHVNSGGAIDVVVDRSIEFCISCHDIGQGHADPFIGDHSSMIEHPGVLCVVCHDPHASARYDRDRAIRIECEDCHRQLGVVGQVHSLGR